MKYLLDNVLVYHDEDGSLSLVDAPDEHQTLTCTANAILKLLVAHHGIVVERDTFLQTVWDERGLQGSNNSLNQYISILRRVFTTLVPDTLFIVTVPKVGFMLSADIPVVPLEDAPKPAVIERRAPRWKPEYLFCAALTLVVMMLCIGAVIGKHRQQSSDVHLLTHIDSCPVYTFAPLADVFRSKAVELAKTLQREGNLPCLRNSLFYMHIQNTLFYGHEGRLVLSQCSLASGNASACRTLYYYEW